MHLKHSEYVRQTVRVCKIRTYLQTATDFAAPPPVAGVSIGSFRAGGLPPGIPTPSELPYHRGLRLRLSPGSRPRVAPQAIRTVGVRLESNGRVNVSSARLDRVDLDGSALPCRLAAGTRDLRYRYSPPIPVCYSHRRTRVPPNGSRATAPARPSPEASRWLRCSLRRRPATPLVTRPSPHRPRRVLCAF
jgi:hypothetical protein